MGYREYGRENLLQLAEIQLFHVFSRLKSVQLVLFLNQAEGSVKSFQQGICESGTAVQGEFMPYRYTDRYLVFEVLAVGVASEARLDVWRELLSCQRKTYIWAGRRPVLAEAPHR